MEYRNVFSLCEHKAKNQESKDETSTTESTNKEFLKKTRRCCVLQSFQKMFPEIEKYGQEDNEK